MPGSSGSLGRERSGKVQGCSEENDNMFNSGLPCAIRLAVFSGALAVLQMEEGVSGRRTH